LESLDDGCLDAAGRRIAAQRQYYGRLFETFGDDARALGHAGRLSQRLRFELVSRLFEHEREPFTVHEVGCATGHFGEFLTERYPLAEFSGSDIHPPFVEMCRRKFPGREFLLRDAAQADGRDRYDYVVNVGLFNCRGVTPRDDWQNFVYDLVAAMYRRANRGIGVTFLTTYIDEGRAYPDLHYQDERAILDYTARSLTRHVVLDLSGPLYEFGFRAYTPGYLRRQYPEPELAKYFAPKPATAP
jgi:hypothetical protein